MHKDICPHDGKYCTCYPVCEANGENMDSSNDKVQRIIRFCEDVIGMKLEPWQRTWLKNWVLPVNRKSNCDRTLDDHD